MSKTRKIFATLTMVAVATAVSLTAVSGAQAHRTGFRHSHHDHRAGDVALGALGGLIVGGVIANSARRQRREAFPPPPVRRAGRSAEHVYWCDQRYRSYNIRTDTFTGYDGRQHYCNSPYPY